ncbi:MAG: hypothetical protein IJ991_07190, partial [Thermoguttaceae bacterium]|nr:hypothetical protein [Thermoguttaceae bacterium]
PMTITYDTFHPEVYSKAVLQVPAGTKEAYEAVDCFRRRGSVRKKTSSPTDWEDGELEWKNFA